MIDEAVDGKERAVVVGRIVVGRTAGDRELKMT